MANLVCIDGYREKAIFQRANYNNSPYNIAIFAILLITVYLVLYFVPNVYKILKLTNDFGNKQTNREKNNIRR